MQSGAARSGPKRAAPSHAAKRSRLLTQGHTPAPSHRRPRTSATSAHRRRHARGAHRHVIHPLPMEIRELLAQADIGGEDPPASPRASSHGEGARCNCHGRLAAERRLPKTGRSPTCSCRRSPVGRPDRRAVGRSGGISFHRRLDEDEAACIPTGVGPEPSGLTPPDAGWCWSRSDRASRHSPDQDLALLFDRICTALACRMPVISSRASLALPTGVCPPWRDVTNH